MALRDMEQEDAVTYSYGEQLVFIVESETDRNHNQTTSRQPVDNQ